MKKIFLYSLTSLAVTASSLAAADQGQEVEVPALEGGFTASVGTFYVTPTSDFQDYADVFHGGGLTSIANVNPGYQFGIDASIGYIFEETANSVEIFWRNISTSDSGSAAGVIDEAYTQAEETPFNAYGDLGYELESFDLMFSQFVNLGQVMQLRFLGGLAYLDLERSETVSIVDTSAGESQFVSVGDFVQSQSKFQGWGPRVAIDTRYGFDDDIEGFGIVGGGSMAYFQGDLDTTTELGEEFVENNPGNHAVLNFRANLGIDYVYFFDNDEGSTLGLELGYLIDFYDDGAAATDTENGYQVLGGSTETTSISFAGPYLNLKGVF